MIKNLVNKQKLNISLFRVSGYGFTNMDKYPNELHTIRKPEQKIYDDSTLHQIKEQFGLQRFLIRTYKITFLSIATSLTIAKLFGAVAMINPMGYAFGGFLLSFGGVVGVKRFSYQNVTENVNGTFVYKTMNSFSRLVSYSAVVTGIGLSLAPMIGPLFIFNPGMLSKALIATGAIFGGSGAFAYIRPRGSLLYLQGPLMGGLFALIALQLMGYAGAILGFPYFAGSVLRVDVIFGIALFCAINAYDTHKAIQMYHDVNADHLQCSLSFYLNFINILIRVLQFYRNKD